jgi:transposase
MRELVDVHYPRATCIRLVQDNLSIHKPGALYEAFAPAEARRILRRLEFHFTPKHASWLNMVECEISVLQRQCLGRRIEDPKRLRIEIAAWQRRRNKLRARIKWMFTTDKALAKLGRAYPVPPKSQNHCDEPLIGIPLSRDLEKSLDHNLDVEPKAPVVNVPKVQFHAFSDVFHGGRGASGTVALCPTRQPRFYMVPKRVALEDLLEIAVVSKGVRSWPDQRHLAP